MNNAIITRITAGLIPALCLGWLTAFAPAPASAQGFDSCEETTLEDPERTVYDCGNGLVFEAEAAAALGGNPGADEITLEDDAVFVEGVPQSGNFQILTPHAIATVRGTVFSVDVYDTGEDGQTSVFVVEGVVEVTRRDGSDGVSLEAGEGVDVVPGEPLEVATWGDQRVAELLARFGR